MDDKGHKRMRHEILEDISRYNIGGGSGGGSASTKQIPAGCHLDIRPATSHLFLGQPVEVEVRLLDDEDVVQPTTVGINVTVANEDNKVLPNQPDKFQLTPTRPALLDGTGTFQLILGPGSVRTGTRVKIHVEACAGGVEVKAHSSPLMVCRSALNVVRQPPENWYKDEGGRNNCIDIEVQVRVKTPGSPQSGQPQPNIPLNLALVYESGTEVHTQDILEVQANTHLVTNETGRAQLKFKITEVSQRHQSQKFRVKISPDVRTCPVARDVAPVVTIPVQVLSKRKNRKLRGERQPTQGGHSPVYSPLNSGFSGRMSTTSAVASASLSPASHWSPPTPSMGRMHSPMYPSSAAPPAPASHSHPHQQAQAHAIPLPQQHQPSHPHPHPQQQQQPPPQPLPIYQSPSQADPPLRVPLKDATGSLHEIFKWADAVLQLLQMELQWEHIGYEREEDGTVSYSRPLWRCPVCRTCKGSDHPHQKHSMDCRLGGLLTEFKDTKEIFGVAAREHAVGTAAMAVAKGGGVTSTGRSGNGSGNGNGGSGNGGHGGGGGAPGGGGSGGGTSGSSGGVGGGGGRGGIGSPTRPGFAHMNGPSRDPKRGNSEMDRLIGETTMEQTLANMPDGVSMGDIDRREYLPSSYSRGAPLPGHPQHSTEPPPHLTTLYHGITAGLSHFFSNLQANSSLEGMPRQRSVALFVPRRTSLTPAEERAYFIMLQSADNGAGGGGGGGSGKRLTVFSKTGRLLGFYEDKWEREQVHLLFLDVDNENCISDAVKESLESKLDAAIEEDDETRNGAAASGGDGGRGRNREAMETDDMDNGIVAPPDAGGDDSGAAGIRRRPPGPSSKPSISRPGTPGVKQEFSGGGVGEAGGRSRGRGGASFGAGARGVYRLSDFKDYHEMKEKAFLDSLGSIDTSGVFEPAAGGPLGSMRGL